MADEQKRGRGRPPLTDEQKAMRQTKSKRGVSSTKEGGYLSQKRYRQNHPDRVREQKRKQGVRLRETHYEPKLRLPREAQDTIAHLMADAGLTITQLFAGAVEEKYGVTLQKPLDISES